MERVAELVRERSGLVFPEARVPEVEATVRRAMNRRGIGAPQHLAELLARDASERDALVAELTIGETYFQRDASQFDLLRTLILPELLALADDGRPIRAWSAGCASGEEPYSIAMVLDELGALDRADIVGTDIARPRLADAQRAVYSRWSLRTVPDDLRERYFRGRGRYYELAPRIRERVDFRYLNLAEDKFPSLSAGIWGMDLILCRNVLIYFDRETIERVARRLIETLSEDGFLVMGASDPPIGEMVECDVIVTHAGLIYRRLSAAAAPGAAWRQWTGLHQEPVALQPVRREEPAPPLDAAAGPWPELERAAGEELPDASGAASGMDAAGADAPGMDAYGAPGVPAPGVDAPQVDTADAPAPGLEQAEDGVAATTQQILDAYARRDFDSVRMLAAAAAGSGTLGAAGWLSWLRALANQGCIEEAADVAERAVSDCGPSAELLYLQAVLQLQTGHAAAAAALARQALYLNRQLAVAHLTLAEAQRRLGNIDGARRSLRSAASLLGALPADAPVPGSDGERAGRLAQLARTKLELLVGDPAVRQA
jgi:chemotaxis protein methyltransferase CheR